MVRIVIGALTDKAVLKTNTNVVGMSFHAAMFGELAKFFKLDMVDPLDKPGRRASTFKRIFEYLSTEMFNKDQDMVRKACSLSMIEILQNVFPELLQPEGVEVMIATFITPLLKLYAPGVAN